MNVMTVVKLNFHMCACIYISIHFHSILTHCSAIFGIKEYIRIKEQRTSREDFKTRELVGNGLIN